MRVIICGGGVIGTSIAYFLSRRGAYPIVVERTGLASAASGKSGGFLALDWCDGSPLEQLARRSFELHSRLPGEIHADWGYRRLQTFGGFGQVGGHDPAGLRSEVGWVSGELAVTRRLGSEETTAQVIPGKFTEALMRAAERHGAELRIGAVTGLAGAEHGGRAEGVLVDGELVEAEAVVVAMGPWSILASQWLPLPGVYGLKGHSLVFDTGGEIPPQSLFLEYREQGGAMSSPEVFPRADGTTYVCGVSSESPLPVDPAEVRPDPGAIERLEAICAGMSPALQPDRIIARQACYRPVTRDGLPLIGAVPRFSNVHVATGHSVWGILNAPATGEAVAELLLDGAARQVDLSPFSPGRMKPLERSALSFGAAV